MIWPKDYINKVICEDCLGIMMKIPEKCIDLVITSPPYYNAKNYIQFDTYQSYLEYMRPIYFQIFRVLTLNGRICVNVPDGYGRNPWIPIYADTIKMLQGIGFILRGSIVWNKQNSAGKTSWGSWRSSSNPCLIDEHEMIIVAHKENPKIDGSGISKKDFMSCMHSVWNIKPQTRSNHPAPFPTEIPERLIKFYSGRDSIILDPFIGSGTTAVAAKKLNRRFIGIDISKKYCEIAEERLKNIEQMV